MATHEIAQGQWKAFFDEFTQKRAGTLVEIESVSPQSGIKTSADYKPLVSIGYDGESVHITAESGIGPNVHTVSGPKMVYHKSSPGVMSEEVTEGEIIEITSTANPPITYLRFKPSTEGNPATTHTNSLES